MTVDITGGRVSIEDGTKSAEEYAPARKVQVEIAFDGGEEALDVALEMAETKIDQYLNRAPRVQKAAITGSDAPVSTRTRRTKEQIAADNAAKAAAVDPISVLEDPEVQDHIEQNKATAVPVAADPADDWSSDPEPVAPAVATTDADLNSATQKRNEDLGQPTLIRELIATFNPDATQAFQLKMIPAARRQEYLTKLAALKKPS